jgi:hypothetical protein
LGTSNTLELLRQFTLIAAVPHSDEPKDLHKMEQLGLSPVVVSSWFRFNGSVVFIYPCIGSLRDRKHPVTPAFDFTAEVFEGSNRIELKG